MNKEIIQSYMHTFLRTLSVSLIAIFVPIYMLNLGYPLWQVISTSVIAQLAFVVSAFFGQKLQKNTSIKKIILSSMLLNILFYLSLISLKEFHWNFILFGIIIGLPDGAYWQSILTLFAAHTEKKKEGKESGVFVIMQVLGTIVTPFVSALIIMFAGFSLVSYIALALYLCSIIPLYFTVDKKIKTNLSWKKIISRKNTLKESVMFIVRGMGLGSSFLLPLWIFILSKEYLLVGGLASLANIFLVVGSYFYGVISDKLNKIKLTKIGYCISAFGILCIIFFQNIIGFSIGSILLGLGAISETSGFAYICKVGKDKKDPSKYVALKEISSAIGRMIIILSALTFGFIPAFMLTAVAHLLFTIIKWES